MANVHPTNESDNAWYDRVRHTPNPQERMRFSDGLVGCATADGKYVITSPNTTYIPLPVIGHVDISPKANGFFGMEDPVLWPQVVSDDPEYFFYSCLPQHATAEEIASSSATVWRPVADEDFEVYRGSMVTNFYVLGAARQQELLNATAPLVARAAAYHKHNGPDSGLYWMRRSVVDAMDRLSHPATRRDLVRQWACLRRHCALLTGWLRWRTVVWAGAEHEDHIEPARLNYMGGFTTDGSVAQKFYQAGIPVWYMRLTGLLSEKDIVLDKAEFVRPAAAMVTPRTFSSDVIYSGPVGDRQFKAILAGHRYVDIERVPFPHDYESPTSSSSSRQTSKSAKPYNKKPAVEREGRSKFEDFNSPNMPPSLPVWQSALREVNRATPPRAEEWGYWLPEPALVVGPTSDKRVVRQVRHWLMARVPWLYLTRENSTRRSLPVYWWRWYLSDGPVKGTAPAEPASKKGRTKAKIVQFFEDTFKECEVNPPRDVYWQGNLVEEDAFPQHRVCQEVAWELSHLAFQVEFMALDDHFLPKFVPRLERYEFYDQIFASSPTVYFKELPASNVGLTADAISERADALEAMRRVMLAWPDVPQVLALSSPVHQLSDEAVLALECTIVRFYTQSFFNVAGRATVLPRRLPVP